MEDAERTSLELLRCYRRIYYLQQQLERLERENEQLKRKTCSDIDTQE